MEHIILGTNVLVKQKEALKRTPGGIVVPDASQTKPLQGIIVKMGIGKEPYGHEMVGLDEGDEVLFDRFAGTPVELDGEKYLVMSDEDILIILKRG